MQNVVSASVLADILFDEFDGKDRNPFREKGVRSRASSPVPQMLRGPYYGSDHHGGQARGVLQSVCV
jgi:hypothetical protein